MRLCFVLCLTTQLSACFPSPLPQHLLTSPAVILCSFFFNQNILDFASQRKLIISVFCYCFVNNRHLWKLITSSQPSGKREIMSFRTNLSTLITQNIVSLYVLPPNPLLQLLCYLKTVKIVLLVFSREKGQELFVLLLFRCFFYCVNHSGH